MDGTLTTTTAGFRLHFTRELDRSTEVAWGLLTDPERRGVWFFPGRIDLTPGGVVELADSAEGVYGTVRAIEPRRLLEFTWSSKDAPGDTVIRFELTPADSGSRLDFTHELTQESKPDRMLAGWHSVIDDFVTVLDGGSPDSDPGRWPELLARYNRLFP